MSKKVTNTTDAMRSDVEKMLFLADSMAEGSPGGAILDMEARGQRELVNSTQLPNQGSNNPEILAMGIIFGEVSEGDSLFREATLPQGWKLVPSDHSMWSHVVDADGNQKIAVFYKAAFYDRDAFMRPAHS